MIQPTNHRAAGPEILCKPSSVNSVENHAKQNTKTPNAAESAASTRISSTHTKYGSAFVGRDSNQLREAISYAGNTCMNLRLLSSVPSVRKLINPALGKYGFAPSALVIPFTVRLSSKLLRSASLKDEIRMMAS